MKQKGDLAKVNNFNESITPSVGTLRYSAYRFSAPAPQYIRKYIVMYYTRHVGAVWLVYVLYNSYRQSRRACSAAECSAAECSAVQPGVRAGDHYCSRNTRRGRLSSPRL